jgi:uracil-DNA glycosylase
MDVKIDISWKEPLETAFKRPSFHNLVLHIKTEKSTGQVIYPPGSLLFNAFNKTSFSNVKIVILGQDPYHGPGQAMGLSFSVPRGITPPPSLVNVFKELRSDIGMPFPTHGDLTQWAEQGVLLLNAALSVRANEPNSHSKIGWHDFTDSVIEVLSEKKSGLVFMLWGRFAQEKTQLIDEGKHLILKAAHPSPFSAEKGFFGCKHFSRANLYLSKQGIEPIDWHLDK